MIKVIFYDAKGCIDNVAMHPVSRIHTGQDIVEMAFKKSTVKNWKNKSKELKEESCAAGTKNGCAAYFIKF